MKEMKDMEKEKLLCPTVTHTKDFTKTANDTDKAHTG